MKSDPALTRLPTVGPWPLNTVQRVDCLEFLRQLPDGSVDLALADPPYNLAKGGNWSWDNSVTLPGFGGAWQKAMPAWDNLPLGEYFAFTLAWLGELKRIVRPTGSLWIHGTYHNAGLLNVALQALEIEIINEVVWYKRNSFPNLSGRRLTASHETILWAHTGGKQRKYRFNYTAARELECPEDALKTSGKQLRTVWDIPNNKTRLELRHGKHPTQKPLRLIQRMLDISAAPGNTVLIPFAGAGSECVAARQFGARFLACELEGEYVEIARRRLAELDEATCDWARGKVIAGEKPTAVSPDRSPRSQAKPPRDQPGSRRAVPSLLKWTGSKRSQAAAIAEQIPPHGRYLEPFLGGGAMLYLAGQPGSLASDLYLPLIELWRLVQATPEQVIADYRGQWQQLRQELLRLEGRVSAGESLPRYFYEVRERFNREPNPLDLNFLMRTCVNGIVRFNAQGQFNNSFHLSRRGMEPDRFANVVAAWHARLQGVELLCQDYEVTLAAAERGDFVYLDPPYANNQQRYTANLDLDRFFANLEQLNRRGVHWALSFDGRRGEQNLTHAVPPELFQRQLLLASGNSAVHKVLNGPIEAVQESLYLNYG